MNASPDRNSNFINELTESARRNPISAALIGMGVVWLLADRRTVNRVGDLWRNTSMDRLPDAVKDRFQDVKSGIEGGAEAVTRAASNSVDAVSGRGADAIRQAADFAKSASRGGDFFERAQANLADMFEAQPLALGAIGLAIGVGIAAALPSTDVEKAYLGDASQTLKSRTAEITRGQIDSATTLVNEVIDATSQEARKQGLTSEALKAAAGDVADKLGRVVDAARSGVTNQVR